MKYAAPALFAMFAFGLNYLKYRLFARWAVES